MADVSFDDIAAALEGLAEAFNAAPAQGGSIYDPPPDGDYQAFIHEFNFVGWDPKPAMNGQPAKAGGIGLKVNYQVTNDAEYTGRIVGAMYGLAPEKLGYLKGWLNTLGVNTEDLSLAELRPAPGGILESLLDTPVMVRVKRNGGYTNVYLESRLGDPVLRSDVTPQGSAQGFMPMSAPAGSNAVKGADDDIPF